MYTLTTEKSLATLIEQSNTLTHNIIATIQIHVQSDFGIQKFSGGITPDFSLSISHNYTTSNPLFLLKELSVQH